MYQIIADSRVLDQTAQGGGNIGSLFKLEQILNILLIIFLIFNPQQNGYAFAGSLKPPNSVLVLETGSSPLSVSLGVLEQLAERDLANFFGSLPIDTIVPGQPVISPVQVEHDIAFNATISRFNKVPIYPYNPNQPEYMPLEDFGSLPRTVMINNGFNNSGIFLSTVKNDNGLTVIHLEFNKDGQIAQIIKTYNAVNIIQNPQGITSSNRSQVVWGENKIIFLQSVYDQGIWKEGLATWDVPIELRPDSVFPFNGGRYLAVMQNDKIVLVKINRMMANNQDVDLNRMEYDMGEPILQMVTNEAMNTIAITTNNGLYYIIPRSPDAFVYPNSDNSFLKVDVTSLLREEGWSGSPLNLQLLDNVSDNILLVRDRATGQTYTLPSSQYVYGWYWWFRNGVISSFRWENVSEVGSANNQLAVVVKDISGKDFINSDFGQNSALVASINPNTNKIYLSKVALRHSSDYTLRTDVTRMTSIPLPKKIIDAGIENIESLEVVYNGKIRLFDGKDYSWFTLFVTMKNGSVTMYTIPVPQPAENHTVFLPIVNR